MASVDSALTKITATKILVVGDVMLDRYWFGDVERISPEAPVPVVSVNEVNERMGGAANAALNIVSLGGQCCLFGVVGDDAAGVRLEEIATKSGIHHGFIIDYDSQTSVKQRIVSRNQQLLRADFEGHPSENSTEQLLAKVAEQIADHDVLILSDYGKGTLVDVSEMIRLARKAGVTVLVDPKGADFSRYRGATLITPNLKEFELVVGKVTDDDMLQDCASGLITEFELEQLLVTLSERGLKLFGRSAETIHSPARTREVYDVSGAGDTVIAVMAMCFGAKLESEMMLQIANSAAGVVVSKLGTATASMAELKTAMLRDAGQVDARQVNEDVR